MLLSEAVEAYIRRKQLMGRKYVCDGKELRSFGRLYPTLRLSDLRTHHILTLLNHRPLSRGTWIGRYKRIHSFLNYCVSKRQLTGFRMPPARRPLRRNFTPYIFTPLQMRSLLARAPAIQSRKFSEISPEMFRTLVIFVYATGCWIGEALALKWSDIDFDEAVIAINSRVGTGREIPIGADLKRMLLAHEEQSNTALVFATVSGRCISYHRAAIHFWRVRKLAHITRTDNSTYEPGFRDLRHTFAVERITDWYRQGADIDLMLPRLAHYLGLFTCTITERYLPLVPEHFRKQLDKIEAK